MRTHTMIGTHLTEWLGYPVKQFQTNQPLNDLSQYIYVIRTEYDRDTSWADLFQSYLSDSSSSQTHALITGAYSSEMYEESPIVVLDALIAAKDQLPQLKALFINDIISEENEISWIINCDHAPVLHAYPTLEHYQTRGGQGLRFANLSAPQLKSLVIESGGLSQQLISDIARAQLPSLTHLSLYLGTEDYGASHTLADIQQLLASPNLCHVKQLGLCNSEIQDEVLVAVLNSPVLAQLEHLDCSLGILKDAGGQALLDAEAKLGHLESINLSYHYLSDGMIDAINNMAKRLAIEIDLSERKDAEDEDWFFVSIGE